MDCKFKDNMCYSVLCKDFESSVMSCVKHDRQHAEVGETHHHIDDVLETLGFAE